MLSASEGCDRYAYGHLPRINGLPYTQFLTSPDTAITERNGWDVSWNQVIPVPSESRASRCHHFNIKKFYEIRRKSPNDYSRTYEHTEGRPQQTSNSEDQGSPAESHEDYEPYLLHRHIFQIDWQWRIECFLVNSTVDLCQRSFCCYVEGGGLLRKGHWLNHHKLWRLWAWTIHSKLMLNVIPCQSLRSSVANQTDSPFKRTAWSLFCS